MQCVYLSFEFPLFELQYLEASSDSKANQKTKGEIKENIDESFVNRETDNPDIEENARMVEKPENAANIIHEFETTITSNEKNIIWLG